MAAKKTEKKTTDGVKPVESAEEILKRVKNVEKTSVECPECGQTVKVRYGKNVPCPECGEKMNIVHDDEEFPEPKPVKPWKMTTGAEANNFLDSIQKGGGGGGNGGGFSSGSLSGYNPQTCSSPNLHEGKQGGLVRGTGVNYSDIGGLDQRIFELDLVINGAEKYPQIWAKLGKKNTRAVLLSGPPGTGKTLLAQALANQQGRKVCVIKGAESKGWRQGASEANMQAAYDSVAPNGILIIDEVDAIGGKRESMVNETNVSMVSTLCSMMDGAGKKDNVVIIGTTNKPHMLEEALRRPGRFDLEIVISPPDEKGRLQIFKIHTRNMPLASDVDLSELARRSHGFTGADIAGVCAKVGQTILQTAVKELIAGGKEADIIPKLTITQEQLAKAVKETVPSLIRDGYAEIADVKWTDIGGLEDAKKELQRIVLWPLLYPDLLKKMNMRQPKGMILFGDPGCGKTLLAKALATESEFNFLTVKGPALLSQWVGQAEAGVRDIFAKARQASPCIIFLDEIDALAPARGSKMGSSVTDSITSMLLTEMDGAAAAEGNDVFVIAATNRPELIDPALLRPGRLDIQYKVPLPDAEAREEIIKIHLRHALVDIENINLPYLVEQTAGKSGAMIEWLCTSAKRIALDRYINTVIGKGKKEVEDPQILFVDFGGNVFTI